MIQVLERREAGRHEAVREERKKERKKEEATSLDCSCLLACA
jgi:hypothetical protein